VPLVKELDFEQLKPEVLHAVIKCGAQLADVGQAMGLSLDPPVDLEARRHADLGIYKPQTGALHTRACKVV
jgi:hypothetical protein